MPWHPDFFYTLVFHNIITEISNIIITFALFKTPLPTDTPKNLPIPAAGYQ